MASKGGRVSGPHPHDFDRTSWKPEPVGTFKLSNDRTGSLRKGLSLSSVCYGPPENAMILWIHVESFIQTAAPAFPANE
jgi:hypothetical protein